ncbi:Ger(x)C family spore germination protein [Natribacillus halophilus]|uniref:Germination protein, Ger(X)C family n=1 Tax=Natribacillus halophilus TaxID=549003 RepID=A0A1G8KSA6_9BACI|nr:Ger(x)C family spore germination protein [Natribacillus halophilus]SDI46272.1 germination protein, Ger(x)C family [Natribacillus halophilus]
MKVGARFGFFALLCLCLTGCWDGNDIEQRANVLALAIDEAEPGPEEDQDDITYVEDGLIEPPQEDMINVTAQIAVPGEVPLGPIGQGGGGGEESDPVWVLEVTGRSLNDALSHLQQEVAEDLFLGQLRIIIVNEDVARNGVDRFNESLRRNAEVRRNAWMIVSAEEAGQYMDLAPDLQQIPTLYLANMIENAVELGKFPEDYIGLFWRLLSSKGQEGFLPYFEIMGDEQIKLGGMSYFKGDEMTGTVTPFEIGVYMGIIGFEQGGYEYFVKVPDTDSHILLDTLSRDTTLESEIKDGQPRLNLAIRFELTIQETEETDNMQLQNARVLEKIEQQEEQVNADAAEQLIQDMQEEQADIFGFGEQIRAKHPGYWNENVGTNEQWQEVFQDVDVDVDVIINLRRVGTQAT